ncbi:Signal peptidase I-like protein [Halorubrum saccharovorum]|uniref:Signal peptidase I-like protein n=1 Tax=Halorubrum saccharovorum TaxID=2248 RepID=A0A081EX96_9EURY|nr:S26 family signal peptidase [Halorubrum saccharovorum]KDS92034.1 Signal peptidase I-like protein [Halorubrum saccharovorum]
MDEGDRSGSDELDRETGSADSDTGNSDPVGDDPTASDDPEGGDPDDTGGDDSAGNDFDDGFDDDSAGTEASEGDSGNDVDEAVSEGGVASSGESGVETGSESDTSDGAGRSGRQTERAAENRVETGRSGGETSRDRTESNPGLSASDQGILYRFRHDREGPLMWIREMLSSVVIVLVIGLVLFGVSGVWPPMVAVESGSMEPNMEVGDLVFVTDPGRLAPDAADNDIGVVTHEVGERADYRTFGSYGSVVIYRPPGRTASPIIHRAMFHVEEGENWYDRADDRYHSAADCGELTHCPAPHDGFITLGDNNGAYDQANGLAAPVKADWVTGVARVRVPYLGYVRLIATGQAEPGDVVATSVAIQAREIGVNEVSDWGAFNENPTVPDAKATVSGGDVAAGTIR